MSEKCPKCGHDLIKKIVGSSVIIKCSNCDYNVATTYSDPINEDETDYSIILERGNSLDISVLKCISKILNSNYIKAKEIINNAPISIYHGSAEDVLIKKRFLDENKIRYNITPSFPY